MIRDLVHSIAMGIVHGIAYVALLIFGGAWMAKPEIDSLLEVLP